MTNNTPKIKRNTTLPAVDEQRVAKSQKRVNLLYRRLRSWRAVGKHLKCDHRYAYDLGTKGTVPSNPDIRVKLFLPRVLPSERKPSRSAKVRVAKPKIWEKPDLYLKELK